VEGANILTRSMIIFGQGAMRCHPYIFSELTAALLPDAKDSLQAFDQALMGHLGFTVSNFFRTLVLGLSSGTVASAPASIVRRYFQQASRFSSAFALLADMALIVLGGSLKRKESISARLGDILSYLYALSAILKHYQDQGNLVEDLPFVRWASLTCLYQIQQSIDDLLDNFPVRWLAIILRILIFPAGKRFTKPNDKLNHKVAQLLLSPTPARDRLTEGAFIAAVPGNAPAIIQEALLKVIAAEAVEKIIKLAVHDQHIKGDGLLEQAADARTKKIISEDQLALLLQAEEFRANVIAVDDFASEELAHGISN
jgi:acyl-CoA dehydrogenase